MNLSVEHARLTSVNGFTCCVEGSLLESSVVTWRLSTFSDLHFFTYFWQLKFFEALPFSTSVRRATTSLIY